VSPRPAGSAEPRVEHVDRAPGAPVEGPETDHLPLTGTPPIAAPIPGASAAPTTGAPTNAAPTNGAPTNAAPTNGVPPPGAHPNPAPTNGSAMHGADAPVASMNGMTPTGVPPRPTNAPPQNGSVHSHGPAPAQAGHPAGPGPGPGEHTNPERNGQCTAPQLRRFIKSRPYVPMHELRRRFGIDGGDDDVTPVKLDPGWVYVGLPNREGSLLGDLLRAGEIGYELSLDPRTPIVIGVYPMRPIPRG
jgi:hypothetical protein